jgi:hypothetical protein
MHSIPKQNKTPFSSGNGTSALEKRTYPPVTESGRKPIQAQAVVGKEQVQALEVCGQERGGKWKEYPSL